MKILVVDDSRLTHSVLQNYLRKHTTDTELITAINGEEAIEKCKAEKPAMIFMDMMMPGITGVDAIKRIREFNHSVKIIAMSAEVSFQNPAIEAGAQLFLKKPLTSEEVVKAIESLK